MINLKFGDCIDVMKGIQDGSVDMILADPPFGMTEYKWDSIIPLQPMWKQLKRVIKPNGAIVLMASQPFTTTLISSNMEMFKYEWIWKKNRPTNHAHAKNKPMKKHENIIVFSQGTTVHASQSSKRMMYNPQGLVDIKEIQIQIQKKTGEVNRRAYKKHFRNKTGYPNSILEFSKDKTNYHPTQKPVALMEYLIKTYTNEGDTVLDFCMGSCTTGLASQNLGRPFIGIENNLNYFEIAEKRIRGELDKTADS